jgi:hypothetical protein
VHSRAQRLLALTAAIWHNWTIGAPVKRSLTAYDHDLQGINHLCLGDTEAQVSHGSRDGLPVWNQLGLLPVEQWCSAAQQERNEMDPYLVEQVLAAVRRQDSAYAMTAADQRPTRRRDRSPSG